MQIEMTKEKICRRQKKAKSKVAMKAEEKPLATLKPVQNRIILHVAEKPSIAASIAKALSQGSSNMEKEACVQLIALPPQIFLPWPIQKW